MDWQRLGRVRKKGGQKASKPLPLWCLGKNQVGLSLASLGLWVDEGLLEGLRGVFEVSFTPSSCLPRTS